MSCRSDVACVVPFVLVSCAVAEFSAHMTVTCIVYMSIFVSKVSLWMQCYNVPAVSHPQELELLCSVLAWESIPLSLAYSLYFHQICKFPFLFPQSLYISPIFIQFKFFA